VTDNIAAICGHDQQMVVDRGADCPIVGSVQPAAAIVDRMLVLYCRAPSRAAQRARTAPTRLNQLRSEQDSVLAPTPSPTEGGVS
jgi:hypothetical protein